MVCHREKRADNVRADQRIIRCHRQSSNSTAEAALAGLPEHFYAAQQITEPKAGPEIDLPDVVAEVRTAWAGYNQALNPGNIAVQNETFRNDERTVRYGPAENLYGYKAIERYRSSARPIDPPLTLSNTVMTTYGRDFAVASTLTHTSCQSARKGWPPNADMGTFSRGLERRRGACQQHRRTEAVGDSLRHGRARVPRMSGSDLKVISKAWKVKRLQTLARHILAIAAATETYS